MNFFRRAFARFVVRLANYSAVSQAKAAGMAGADPAQFAGKLEGEYVLPDSQLSPAVLMAAQSDISTAFVAADGGRLEIQAELNALLLFFTAGRGRAGLENFVGALVAQGVPLEQAMLQGMANCALLGLYAQRRLDRA